MLNGGLSSVKFYSNVVYEVTKIKMTLKTKLKKYLSRSIHSRNIVKKQSTSMSLDSTSISSFLVYLVIPTIKSFYRVCFKIIFIPI